jgi:hypothetical protein
MSLMNCVAILEDEERIAINASPSSFFFELLQESFTPVQLKDTSTELHVFFDLSPVHSHLLNSMMKDTTTTVNDMNDTTIHLEPQEYLTESNNHADVLRILESLAEREIRDTDRILVCMALLCMALVGSYLWMYVSILDKKVSKSSTPCKASAYMESLHARALTSPPSPMPNRVKVQSARVEANNPDSSQGSKSSLKRNLFEQELAFIGVVHERSSLPPRVANDAVESSPVPPDLPPVDSVVFECCNTPSPEEDVNTDEPVVISPNRDKWTRSNSAPPSFLPAHKTLSPCSRLAHEWQQTRGARRNKRRCHPKHLVPMEKKANRPLPLLSPADSEPVCPTSVSDDSFLNDYW